MTRYLTERGFAQTAPLLGEVVRVTPDGTPRTLVVVQGFVRNQGDGWGWTTDFLHRTLSELTMAEAPAAEPEDSFAIYAHFASALGKRLAEMHAVLAEETDDAAFRPEPATPKETKAWARGARSQLDAALKALAGQRDWADPADAAAAEALVASQAALSAAIDRLAAAGEGALQTRIHGDFHLGQVLVVQGDACIIDFEGEPAKSLAQRRAKSSPMRDVAGLLRSFDYAVASIKPEHELTPGEAAAERHAALLEEFRGQAGSAFLEAYRAVHAETPRPWVAGGAETALLDLFLLEKAAYEICYEAANRPTWLPIPLHGLARLARTILDASPSGKE
jgi:maltose alpha-D-glucosyltransferase/alpha-amylase